MNWLLLLSWFWSFVLTQAAPSELEEQHLYPSGCWFCPRSSLPQGLLTKKFQSAQASGCSGGTFLALSETARWCGCPRGQGLRVHPAAPS